MSPAEWYSTIDINLTGVFHFCHFVVPIMKRLGGGDIVNISSRSARNPHAGGAAYCASKFGLNGLSEVLQLDLRKHRIRVSNIMPGRVGTNFAGEAPQDWHVAPEDVAQAVIDALNLPARTFVGRIELRPSFPPG
jgi:NADP-dependent 3-hydroxy acid dehydrogenase YdfG